MSFLAKLILNGGSEYTVLSVSYGISKMIDHQNRPNSAPKAGLINLTVESSSRSAEIAEWVATGHMIKSGMIIFFKRDADSPMRKLEFKDAYCVNFLETFESWGERPMIIQFAISARELVISNIPISNPWPGMKSGSGSASSGNNITSYSLISENE